MLAKKIVAEALEKIFKDLGVGAPERLTIEEPRNEAHGDLSINAAMLLAKSLGENPGKIAGKIAEHLRELVPQIEKVEVAGPGFCNITFKKDFWQNVILEVEEEGKFFGNNDSQKDKRALVEYVSANPTGPLHIGHGRGAALGDSLARILRACGAEVATEYYLNDAGLQMATLGLSIWLRAREKKGLVSERDLPENFYVGNYIKELAGELLELEPELCELSEEEGRERCRQFGMEKILDGIKKDLGDFDCEHQVFFSEKSLVRNGAVARIFQELFEKGEAYEADGATWFKSAKSGDDHDRVLKKSDGSLTYFATDIAYHKNKFERGYDWIIDVWGADHHGYIPRMKAAIAAVGENPDNFTVLLVQLVNLMANGQKIAMSTRAGKFETLADVIDDVGSDAARFMFLSRSADAPLDFDLELVKRRSMDNPVYYVQYAHARIAALLRRAETDGLVAPALSGKTLLTALDSADDLALLRKIAAFPDTVASAGRNLAPQYIGAYLLDLATRVHAYYAHYQVLGEEKGLARLVLLRSAGQVIRNGLYLLGVSAPENM